MRIDLAQLDSLDVHAQVLLEEIRKTQDDRMVKQTYKNIDAMVAAYQPKIARLFIKQGNDLVKAFTRMRKHFTESWESDFLKLFDSSTIDTSSELMELIQNIVERAMTQGAKQMIATFKPDIAFSLTNPEAEAYTKDYGATRISGIDDTSKEEIRQIIVTALHNGTSYAELARQLKSKYSAFAVGVPQKHLRSRAELIAVTEIGNAYCEGMLILAHDLKSNGIPMQKRWSTIGDTRVSEGCKDNAAASWIDLDDPFPSGHDRPLRFPGCRCVSVYRRKQ